MMRSVKKFGLVLYRRRFSRRVFGLDFGYIKRSRSLRLVGTISSVALAILGVLAVSPVVDQPESVEAAGTASVTSIDIVSNRTSAKVRIKPINENGTFATSTGNDNIASFDVKTNNYTGYVLKLKANGASGELVNSNSNDSINSISTPAEASTFIADVTGAYTNKWGIKPSVVNGTSNSYYLPAPVNNEEVLMETTTEANPTTGKNYEIGIGAKVDYTKVIGEYTNTYTAVAVGNPATYTINYSLGGITGVTGTVPSPTIGSASTTATVTLASSSLTRTGYDFAGWCYGTLEGTAANPGTTCNGTLVTDRVLFIDLDQTINNEATVYATWTAKKYNITVKPGSNITISLNGSAACSNTTSGCTISNLVYNNSYTLVATPATGYELNSWSPGSYGSIANTSATTTTYTVGAGVSTITATAKAKTYPITLTNSSATTAGSSSVTATYNSATLSPSITNPQRKYTASNFTYTTNNASGATVTNPGTKTYTYTFKGWYTTTSSDVKVINSNGTLVADVSGYTDSNGKWIKNGTATLYAQWSDGTNVTLPSISKQGHNCGWTTTASGATTIGYSSGGSYKLSSNLTLYGVCTVIKYKCKKQYYLQNTSGTFPSTASGSETDTDIAYGSKCTYNKTIANYKGSASNATTGPNTNLTNGAQGSTDCTMGVNGCTLKLYFYRNTFKVTITKAGLVSSVSGDGWKMYQQSVTVEAVVPSYSNFYGWQLNNSDGSVKSTSTKYTFTMDAAAITFYVNADRPAISDLTRTQCSQRANGKQYWVEDTRDGQYYTVTYAGGACWMTRNLAIGCAGTGGTYSASRKNVSLTTSNSDVNSTHNTSEFSNMDSNNTSATSGYTTAAIKCNASKGAWYNYKAATATTVSGKVVSNSSYSICPKNWKLPTLDQIIDLVNDTTRRSNFTRVTGGVYHTGELKYTGTGYWWSRTNYDEGKFYDVRWTSETHLTYDQWFQYVGEYVRCTR